MEEKKEPKLRIAVESLEKTKREITERYQHDIAELDEAIANLKKLPAKKAGNGNGHHIVLPGGTTARRVHSWQGMGLPDAVHAFLSNYEKPIPFAALLTGLQEQGVRLGDPAKPERYQANVKTTVVNNKRRFRYDKKKDTVELRPAVA